MTSSYTKATPPPYEYSSLAPPVAALPARRTQCRQLRIRRRRGMKLLAISGLACLVFLVYAQWNQLTVLPSWRQSRLAADRLQEDLQTCTKLRRKPQDPIGLGRTKNARYVDGQRPILIQNATIWLGEPVEGTSLEDARAGKGYSWTSGDVFVQFGLIQKVDAHISLESLPGDTQIYDAKGRQLTAGIIDMHSHVGVSSLPDLAGTEDTNELSSDITPYVRSIDGLNPLDPQWQVIKSGGVTTSLVLPGSGNNIGGEAFVFKHAIGEKDGRQEISAADMLADPDPYVGSEYAGKILWNNGLTPVYVSDNPVINAQHVLFEAAKAYRYGLPYHVALAGVTTASAELLGLGERLGKIKPGFDADIVVWDSDPLSIGAAPAQVWIDGFAQFENPVELDKPLKGPIAAPHSSVALSGGISHHRNIVFTGVTKILLSDGKSRTTLNGPVNVVVSEGEITCTGECSMEVSVARQGPSHEFIALEDGHLTHSFTAFGSQIGLNAIDYESNTANGESTKFSRGVDGLALDTKKLRVAHQYGITRAVSAPTFSGGLTHRGTSVGFVTDAQHALEKGAVWSEDAAVHYTFTLDVKQGDTPSISTAVGALRKDLLEAVSNNDTISDRHSEQAFLKGVVEGEMPSGVDSAQRGHDFLPCCDSGRC
ncbi:amidohydrolase family protein [Verticillium alfalfae VaMs.102]|uniref:Amidohydrolase family protein n=1 Tax=Verticillium alfalfae (strain VaMs.102 / ATCC MYA-4576 / FGSC 10136) TaxID=526221 RepID=C9SB19_VERA1|nr:amidohydrolase family protein [Verticillium alfalfae VaMs.102]EEY16379.1 amidohydrolase family protein [Verticillium alfalfae VaMs.102]